MSAIPKTVDEILRLHTDQRGCVWYGGDNKLGINSYIEASDFFNTEVLGLELDNISCIRLLGTKANAPLIVALQQRRAADPLLPRRQRIQLCSPALMPTESLRNKPEDVLQSLWQLNHSSALASWHDMTNIDFCSYMIINELRDDPKEVPEVVKRIVPYHPAWLAVSFLEEFDLDSTCRLLAEIIDPRWYRHPFKPNRVTKLYSYLGLTPQNMSAYLGDACPDRHYSRARLAVSAWYNVKSIRCKFLSRYLDYPTSKGLLKATQRFITLLHTVWSYAVAPSHPEIWFDPTMFFDDPDEIKAFEQHKATWKGV